MPRTCVFLLTLALCSNAIAQNEPTNHRSQHQEFDIEQTVGANSSIAFKLAFKSDASSSSDIQIETLCKDKKRTVLVLDPSLELITKMYFPDGNVLQYVVRKNSEDIAFIKIERESCRQEGHCLQSRILLTDTADRIIAQVANAENEDRQIILRDNLSQTVMRGELVKDVKWKVSSSQVSPLLSALVLCAASIEKRSCEEIKKVRKYPIMEVAVTTTALIISAGIYYRYFG